MVFPSVYMRNMSLQRREQTLIFCYNICQVVSSFSDRISADDRQISASDECVLHQRQRKRETGTESAELI